MADRLVPLRMRRFIVLVALLACGQNSPVAAFDNAKKETVCTAMKKVENDVTMFRVMENACPKTIKDLVDARVIEREDKDPWGNSYSFTCDDGGVTVQSAGPDGKPGTDDDLGPKTCG